MPKPKVTVNVEQSRHTPGAYWVRKTVNTITPKVNDKLGELEVLAMIKAGITVSVTAAKR